MGREENRMDRLRIQESYAYECMGMIISYAHTYTRSGTNMDCTAAKTTLDRPKHQSAWYDLLHQRVSVSRQPKHALRVPPACRSLHPAPIYQEARLLRRFALPHTQPRYTKKRASFGALPCRTEVSASSTSMTAYSECFVSLGLPEIEIAYCRPCY